MTVDTRELLREMVRIRHVEEVLADVYRDEQEMRTPVHFSIGQEASAVGVCAALEREDLIYSSHRCHAQYLAKGGDLFAMVAELYGREDGCSRGRGGSVHLVDNAAGFAASSAILGEMISVATGAAWAAAMNGERRVVVTFFGDGAAEEGVFHEAMNFAAVQRLPIVFVCENNGYSLSSPMGPRQPEGATITGWARGYGVSARQVDGNDVAAVHHAAEQAVAWSRAGNGPAFLELSTYRWREHVGPHWDYDVDHRTKAEVDSWIARCPIQRATAALRAELPTIDEDVARWAQESVDEIRQVIAKAKLSPFPRVEDLLHGTYGR
ncbi:thiamine pyrophosphate-dependent dehydrogenase E1 component subunit alpha [Micromonospora sp. WMMD882]|uniref:thiamine pyrophosphate-dependent dehydrogenase E1 component subunit alpha n=1 Tax=Micromonospora sp. WMMD882 TaxID=3015151 RepID=UPI00248BC075|nr:thiamine pyrophosphate-dependent dehydrogenase E1 component subunit alpha [Micromonospora sp. WMMD882]WBB78704.1 thiamine pyrophosphate-dependent dehydrogenase E1 component subunit alpha [Micromonospora sp. WMMD882]